LAGRDNAIKSFTHITVITLLKIGISETVDGMHYPKTVKGTIW